MPARWRACLDGEGEIDLSRVRILSDHQYMWTPGGLGSRMATFFASKALRGRVDPVPKSELPKVFTDPGFKGKLYKLNESVLDIETVVSELIAGLEDRTLKVDWDQDSVIRFWRERVTLPPLNAPPVMKPMKSMPGVLSSRPAKVRGIFSSGGVSHRLKCNCVRCIW